MHACQCQRQHILLLLIRWQRATLVVPSRAELIALPAHHARVAQYGVQQPYSRVGAWHAAHSAGHVDAGCARYDHRFGQE